MSGALGHTQVTTCFLLCTGSKPNIPGLFFIWFISQNIFSYIFCGFLSPFLQVNNVSGDPELINSEFPEKFGGSREYVDDNSTNYDKPPDDYSFLWVNFFYTFMYSVALALVHICGCLLVRALTEKWNMVFIYICPLVA